MSNIILKVIPALACWGIFAYVILQIPYPESLTQANFTQLLPFFASLFLALVFTLNILFKNILLSFSICLGLIFLLILKALDSLNIVTGILIVVATYLLASYFKRAKKKGLTKQPKIPKLTKSL